MFLRRLWKKSCRHIFKTYRGHLEHFLKKFLENVLQTRLKDVLDNEKLLCWSRLGKQETFSELVLYLFSPNCYKFLYSFENWFTFLYKVVKNGHIFNITNLLPLINSSDIGVSDAVRITIGKDSCFIMADYNLYIIYIMICAFLVGVLKDVVVNWTIFIIKFAIYRITYLLK